MNRGADFSPARRLRRSYEFLALRRSGKKLQSRHFFLYVSQGDGNLSRLGLTVSKKVGNAVERNRAKRLLREFFRRNQTRLHFCIDISIIAKPGAAELTYTEVYEELTPLLFPAGGD